MSWLYALPGPVINRATPNGLCGRWRNNSEWLWLAAQAGLSILPLTLRWPPAQENSGQLLTLLVPSETTTRLILMVDGQPLGDWIPPPVKEGCRRLAELSGLRLLGVEMAVTQTSPWTFAGIKVCPPLQAGGGSLLDALARALSARHDPSRPREVFR